MSPTPHLATAHDKMLLTLCDAGAPWSEIRAKWKAMTGDNTAYSTLPNRYSRLKAAYVVIPEEEYAGLLEAKQEVDGEIERERWGRVAERMVEKGGGRWSGEEVRVQWGRLMVWDGEGRGEGGEGE